MWSPVILLAVAAATEPRRNCTAGDRTRTFHCDGGRSAPRPATWDAEGDGDAGPCGFCAEDPATDYLREVAHRLKPAAPRCGSLVVYSAALGENFELGVARRRGRGWPPWLLNGSTTDVELKRSLRGCWFRFVIGGEGDHGGYADGTTPVPLERSLLPYGDDQNMRRNVKVLKMLGHELFPWARRTIWIDAKLRFGAEPRAYAAYALRGGACAAYMGLPAHRTAFADLEKRSLVQHGETIVAAAARRPGVSADLGAVRAQVASYKRRADAAALDALLIDSAYLIRDFSTPRCRSFNRAANCAWFDEIDCYSDRDQLAFPPALARAGVRAVFSASGDVAVVDAAGALTATILAPGGPDDPAAARHWYYSHAVAVGRCRKCYRALRKAAGVRRARI